MQKTKGSVMAYSLIILTIMLTIAASMSTVVVLEKKSAISTDSSVQAFQVADSGIQFAVGKINSDTNVNKTLNTVFCSPTSSPRLSCNVIDGVAQIKNPNPGLTNSSYTLYFYNRTDGANNSPAITCDTLLVPPVPPTGNPVAPILQSIRSVGQYKDIVRAVLVSITSTTSP